MAFDSAEWKRRLAELLKENPDIGRATGKVEINMGEGGITKIYLDKKVKTSTDTLSCFDQYKGRIESATVRVVIG